MKETILLFGFEEREKQRRLVRALLPLKLRVREVEKKDFGRPVGYLSGEKDVLPADDGGDMGNDRSLDGEMLLMAGLSSGRVDQVLHAIRKAGTGPIPYKAVLTGSNRNWNAYQLLEELKKEHESMKNMKA